ncbi:carbohydrate binding family 9 domain-containing protein [Flavobacterium amniphilum]|uniref:DUF5916 domain-containing protein n=1 Tax=Flavobacterium amniphilum TaxID=1834035 RepID=UPI00202A8466|nr:DUF5916 domain-containing protein [Flavobacterium amniphilum]MCL9804761.1 carbohydrate binding family 9 domain-containing protein [Flavobacterium amniphilum]
MGKNFLSIVAIFHTILTFSQTTPSKSDSFEKKKLLTKRISNPISIDGLLDEAEWQNAETATDFVMLEPDNGKPIDPTKKTDVKVLYDDEAIYIGAILNDNEPEKIMREITQRDDDGATDFFGISVNGYNDGQQEFRFIVTAAGVQWDANASSTTGEDASWDAIWESNVKLTEKGWQVEVKLPYSALRFSKEQKQTWGIQFFRQLRRFRQLYTWNYVNNNKGSLEQQSGELTGIESIKTPTRLFFFPYASTYVSNNKENGTKTEFKGGMDIKYGINDAFTLDAILVPDFGQTAFDNQILNLGPFEQQFNENRPFFTEGTDLFNKGNLFYSRRIGGKPSLRKGKLNDMKGEDEIIEDYPEKINLVNALKISGRTKKGLGIGFMNAVTEKTEATLKDTITGIRRHQVVESLANYNILTLDQRFNKNSSVSLINTNVTRNGEFRDANVSALVFDLNTKKNTFNLSGDFKYSYVNEFQKQENKNGYNTSLSFSETSGKIRFSLTTNYITKEFDNNDLGITFKTNYLGTYGNLHYRILKPTKTFNTLTANMNVNSEFENITGKLQAGNVNFNLNSTFKNNDGFGGGLFIRPLDVHDFYAPQKDGRYVTYPEYYETWVYYSSNYNRKFAFDFNPWIGTTSEVGRDSYGFSLSPRYRFSNKLMVILGYDYSKENNTVGFYDHLDDGDIIFEKRDINTSTVYLKSRFALNNKMTININTRYYWSYVDAKGFKELQEDGSLNNIYLPESSAQDFSSWNLDCSYSWWIAPGSQLNILYRNNSGNYDEGLSRVEKNLSHNFQNLFGDKLNHTFSISLRYFLDFNRVKSWI